MFTYSPLDHYEVPRSETFRGLPGMLADSLPDKFGNSLIDAWMAGKGVEKSKITPLDRLAYMGKRGMGALEFSLGNVETALRLGGTARLGVNLPDSFGLQTSILYLLALFAALLTISYLWVSRQSRAARRRRSASA